MEIPCAKTNGAETSLNIEQMFGVPLMNSYDS